MTVRQSNAVSNLDEFEVIYADKSEADNSKSMAVILNSALITLWC